MKEEYKSLLQKITLLFEEPYGNKIFQIKEYMTIGNT
jgi:hypothetical protein